MEWSLHFTAAMDMVSDEALMQCRSSSSNQETTMRKDFRKLLGVACACALMAGMPAHAYTECTGTISAVWTGDGGGVQVVMTGGMSWNIAPNDPNLKNILAMASLAMLTGKQVVVRFQANGVSCSNQPTRSDVAGMYVYN
ncbi:hypothetical protein RQP53_13780 [Paucibacter sp. APW11]|uniref:Uncharacterized protein n=1 Tax=Roseateles aquae TaxID=3077235 RepID=A0ABU3PCN2_9BURK|nr:hypothetical protein [Paucibacter sp. APW11]MDT9000339.1 hypothetical protein [Paucibacter sp. APW11]